ncbi:PAS domain S-box protein [Daejeonella sp.]|uniref:PAS domain-containing sensor histidine kinase n=1 Tax=Daejeonella sp. TaxID=2805397 RepID=UPI00273294EB|nr:PAS domain S-box protein [Daejeonella sp.]
MDQIPKKQFLNFIFLKTLLVYSLPIWFLLGVFLLFNGIYTELLNYSDLTNRTDKVYSSFRNLGVEMNKAATGNSELIEDRGKLKDLTLFFADSQYLIKQLELLNGTANDTLNLRIARQLDNEIHAELPWILGTKVLDSSVQSITDPHITALQNIDSLINAGIKRSSFILNYRRKEFEKSLWNLQLWIIVFFALSIILLVYTSYHLYKERVKTKLKEYELGKSEKRFRTLVEKSTDIIAMLDSKMSPVYHSPSAERFRGYNPDEGKKAIEMDDVHPEDKQRLTDVINLVIAKPGKVVYALFRVRHKLGHYLWLEGTFVNLLQDPDLGTIVANMRDITERRKAEDDLKRSMKEISDYKYALDESAIVAITDQKGVIEHVNDNFCAISGYTKEELIGQDHRIINSAFHPKEFIRGLWKTIANGQIWKGELKNKAKNGRYYWVDTTIIPFLNSDGKPYQYVAIRSDITQRKQAEEELHQKTRQIEDILDRIDEGFIALDKEFRYTYANKRIGEMTGREPASLIGKNVWDEFPEAVGSATQKAFEHAFNEQCYLCDVDHYPPLDLWQENHIYPSEDGIAVFIRDISQQKRHEQAISTAYQRLAFHFTNTPMGVMEWDPEGKVVQWSQQAEIIFGWKASEIIGRNFSELEIILPEQAASDQQLNRKLLNGELERVIGSTKNITKTGNIIFTEWYNSVLKDDEGKVISIVSFINDITVRKEAEHLIISLNQELENKVLARTEQLEQANKDLEAFSYSVSHDLRAPLRAVNGFSTMLHELYRDKLDERAERLISTIVSSTINMGMLIDDLLKFSRLGRKELTIQPVNMDALVRDCLQEIRISYPSLNAEIGIETLPDCLGDQLVLRQVWMNLIENAVKYSSTVDSPRIEINFKETERTVTYLVKDNGVGFDMQYYDKLFGVFQRLHRQSEFEGTGIGLALIKRIIDKHNGKVWAEGEVGKGATFYFTLSKYNK